jgi:hypothetical protein
MQCLHKITYFEKISSIITVKCAPSKAMFILLLLACQLSDAHCVHSALHVDQQQRRNMTIRMASFVVLLCCGDGRDQ